VSVTGETPAALDASSDDLLRGIEVQSRRQPPTEVPRPLLEPPFRPPPQRRRRIEESRDGRRERRGHDFQRREDVDGKVGPLRPPSCVGDLDREGVAAARRLRRSRDDSVGAEVEAGRQRPSNGRLQEYGGVPPKPSRVAVYGLRKNRIWQGVVRIVSGAENAGSVVRCSRHARRPPA